MQHQSRTPAPCKSFCCPATGLATVAFIMPATFPLIRISHQPAQRDVLQCYSCMSAGTSLKHDGAASMAQQAEWVQGGRPGVVYLARVDGVLEVWDFLDRSHEPVSSMTVCAGAIASLSFNPASATVAGPTSRPAPQLLAAGAAHMHTLRHLGTAGS